ncbi:MAG: DUF2867 domain-containing protein [Saprospiraceae bacterium]
MKIEKVIIPKASVLAQRKYDYADSYRASITDPEAKVDLNRVAKAFFTAAPPWVAYLFELRNKIVGLIGLKTGAAVDDPASILAKADFKAGDQLGLFKVYERSIQEMILGADDQHLDFRVSLFLTEVVAEQRELTVTTIVDFHNRLGRIYFFFVKPFHQLIVKRMLKAMLHDLKAN